MRNLRKYVRTSLMLFLCLIVIVTGCSKKGTRITVKASEPVNTSHAPEKSAVGSKKSVELHKYDFTIGFAGDFNFSEDRPTMKYYYKQKNGIRDCLSADIIKHMQSMDLMCVNNEFTYSTRGEKLPGKMYTFRAKPSSARLLKQIGVDLVTLANNHVYDYGKDAMKDTFTALKNAGIDYFGAGNNLKEAMKPCYKKVDGKTIAFVGASRAEKYRMTPQATRTSAGILRCYDTTLLKQEIKEAKKKADIVIAYIHWGTENTEKLDVVQRQTAREYIDAGADVIIGGHPHVLQGMEYYKGKPIVYSMGDFWFNTENKYTMIVKLHFTGNDKKQNLTLQVIPARQKDIQTRGIVKQVDKEKMFAHMEKMSIGVRVDRDGVVSSGR